MLSLLLLLLPLSLLILASLRLLYILRRWDAPRRADVFSPHRPSGAHILISLGSGGHTAEMLALLSNPPLPTSRYPRRTYVISSGDVFSAEKAREFELRLQQQQQQQETGADSEKKGEGETIQQHAGRSYEIHMVPRARRIHQSLLTTPLSCLACLWSCIRLLLGSAQSSSSFSSPPDLILLNGPATSLILVLASIIIRFFAFLPSPHKSLINTNHGAMRTIYVESWARVKTPSLTLRIIAWAGLCDRVVVQHRGLEEKGWGQWRGDIMR